MVDEKKIHNSVSVKGWTRLHTQQTYQREVEASFEFGAAQ